VATFVLIHGANMGGWCWRLVSPALRAAGHNVFAPSLSGCGDRVHQLSPDIGLEDWVEDITNLLYYEDLDNVVLVGHSNGAAVVTAVADRMPARIAHVVYIDGWMLRDGESLWGLIPAPVREWMEKQLQAMGETWKSPAAPVESWVDMARAEGWSDMVGRWAGQRATPAPLKPVLDPIRLKGGEAAAKLPRTLVRCMRSPQPSSEAQAERMREAGFPVIELDATHMCVFSAPHELARLLREIAAPYGL
jgi:pimeloyl-ACP methyl ester carboxylesterase